YGQPLAHPWRAIFREVVCIFNYSYRRFNYYFQGTGGQFCTVQDASTNFGGYIFQPYGTLPRSEGHPIAQGVSNNLLYADGKISYLFNTKHNLRVEAGAVYRRHGIPEEGKHHQTGMATLGIRASFRNFYYDF